MADIANYKDKILQGISEREPNNGIGDVEWEDVGNTDGFKPDDNATLGATVDINLDGLINTHNIELDAVTTSDFAETFAYNSGTEIMEVEVNVNPQDGKVILFVSSIFVSNSNSSTGDSTIALEVKYNGVSLFGQVVVTSVPTQANNGFNLTFSDKYQHDPAQTSADTYLVTNKGYFLTTGNGEFLLSERNGYTTDTYNITMEYASTADGTRGTIQHLSAYALVVKR